MLRRCVCLRQMERGRPMALRVAVMSLTPKGGCVGQALETLGYKCYNLHTCFGPNRGKTDPPKWVPFLLGRGHLDMSMLKEHDAICGLPASGAPERLLRELPQFTKVVLVVETDKERWVEAYKKSVPELMAVSNKLSKRSRMSRNWNHLIGAMYPTLDDRGKVLEPQAMLDRFEDTVKQRVPPHRLLVYHPGDGWEPLLHFLELSIPPPEEPFPQTEYGETSFNNLANRMKHAYYYSTAFVYGGLALCLAWIAPMIYDRYSRGDQGINALETVRKVAGERMEEHVFPLLEHVGPSTAAQGREAVRSFGIRVKAEEPATVTSSEGKGGASPTA
jgi:hypothetical protein